MSIFVFIFTCLLFLSLFVGLPIVVIAWSVINFIENRRNKRYLNWIKHLDELNNKDVHLTR